MAEPGLVGVRYVGPQAQKDDTLLYVRNRTWRRGEVLQVPPGEAAKYFRHPSVWLPEDAPWDEAAAVRALTDAELVQAFRAGDAGRLQHHEPAALAKLVEAVQPSRAEAHAPAARKLADDDAARLNQYVAGLGQALVQGVSASVFQKLEMVHELIRAYPPLIEACITAEGEGKDRPDVMKRLIALRPNALPINDPQQPASEQVGASSDDGVSGEAVAA